MELRIRDLSKTYPNGTQALKGVSLDVPPGMFGLLGRNGAGKSTLMRIIATLQEPDTGTITLEGPSIHSGQAPLAHAGHAIDVVRQKERVRESLGYLPQSFGFHPRVSAERLLDHFAVLKGLVDRRARREVVESLLRRTNLWEVRTQRVGTFSGGMRLLRAPGLRRRGAVGGGRDGAAIPAAAHAPPHPRRATHGTPHLTGRSERHLVEATSAASLTAS